MLLWLESEISENRDTKYSAEHSAVVSEVTSFVGKPVRTLIYRVSRKG